MEKIQQLQREIEKAITGKSKQLTLILSAWLAGGNILLEDIPGVGKTTLAVAMSRAMGISYQRVQFTPEIIPSDIVGYTSYQPETGTYVYQEGAILCHLFLADELNRASGKTQAALLEAMEEKQITVDKETRKLPEPFCVIATQNPYGAVGTQKLPQSQMDRFMVRLSLGYPDHESQIRIIQMRAFSNPISEIQPVMTKEELLECKEMVKQVEVHDTVLDYMVSLAEETRKHPYVQIGVSPRGILALYNMARAYAFMAGRNYVIPDDVAEIFSAVCAHRIVKNGKGEHRTREQIMEEVLKSVPIPKKK